MSYFVLIVIIGLGGWQSGVTTLNVPFHTFEACEKARVAIVTNTRGVQAHGCFATK